MIPEVSLGLCHCRVSIEIARSPEVRGGAYSDHQWVCVQYAVYLCRLDAYDRNQNFGEKSEADSSSLFSMVKPDLSAYRDVNTCTHVCIASCMVLT